jgi:hypothetical protein
MKAKKTWWIFVETGECVLTTTREEGIRRLQELNRWATLTPANVLSEAEFDAGRAVQTSTSK